MKTMAKKNTTIRAERKHILTIVALVVFAIIGSCVVA